MEETFRKAYVYVLDTYAGVLSETDSGYTFSYDRAYMLRTDRGTLQCAVAARAHNFGCYLCR